MLPRPVRAQAENHPLLRGLLPTDVGDFPAARGHWRQRPDGAAQAIFIFCAQGLGWCEIAGARQEIHAGEILVIPPGVPHTYGAHETCPWSIHWFHAQGALLPDFLQALEVGPGHLVFRLTETAPWLSLFEEVLTTLEHGYATEQLLGAAQALGHLLAVLVRDRRHPNQVQPSPAARIARTIAHMKQHLHQPLPLDTLAALANLSRSRYVELFRQQAGYAPIDYFIRLRMHRACQLLDTTGASVKQVAAQLGYEDALYFSRVFRQVNAQSPSEYRKTRKG